MNIGYLRVSTTAQDLDNQRHTILNHINDNDLGKIDFIEVEISSKKTERMRKIDELIGKLSKNDSLFITELSRLGRNMVEVLNIITTLRDKGVGIYFINQPELSSSDNLALDNLKFAIYGFLAESERDFISTRTKQALSKLKADGVKLGNGKKFLKSKYDNEKGEIFKLKLLKMSYASICKLLDSDNSKGWKAQSLRLWLEKKYILNKEKNNYIPNKEYQKFLDLEKDGK
jgi:DNA invertase Pin-like site-specific DNA recombinase